MRVVLAITLMALFLNITYGQLDVSIPLFVHEELHQTGSVLGMMWTGYGLGAIVGLRWWHSCVWMVVKGSG